jgi:hypothetical protein
MTAEHLLEGVAADYDTEGRMVSIKAASETWIATP